MNDALFDDLKAAFRKHMREDMTADDLDELHLIGLEWLAVCLMVSGTPPESIGAALSRAVEAVRRTQN